MRIDWVLPDGQGAGRTDEGRVVRVPGAVPGDVVDPETQQVLVPSADRRPPPCPSANTCGGCDLSVLEPEVRRQALGRMVAHAFRVDSVRVVASPRSVGHRARIKLAVAEGQVGYRPARSHDLVDVDTCLIARPEVAEAHARLRHWVAEARPDGLRSVEIRSDGTRAVFACTGHANGISALGDVAMDGKRVSGNPTLTFSVHGISLRAGPRSFFQVNLEINELLVGHVRDALLTRNVEAVLDLYAGIGNLSLPVAAAGVPVVAVEAPGPGADDLAFNQRGFDRVQAVAKRVERFDASRVAFDGVILDPPRAGAPGVLPRVVRNRPRVIVYVSCHAPSAARDLAKLTGYRLVDVTCFDMFPDTRHIESVAILERG